ncbi:Peroxiredoxin [Zhouia amylolytica]|uniref:Peroxiredoxin n=1 Tax=Zhouia amylolytica TaxID=376730 RepID=A0A1I6T4H6_9FLAO|nr:TlpA disulfide reductase family protein [Zhouia amylolytica]SFS83887.1 Peroxiredoxin [Zhouia amylolytica]
MILFKILGMATMFFITGCSQTNKQTTLNNTNGEPVVISGSFKQIESARDSLRIYFGGIVSGNRKLQVLDTMIYSDSNGRFSFTSSKISENQRITIAFYRKRNSSGRYYNAFRDYLVSPGDTIKVQVDRRGDKATYDFSGSSNPFFELQCHLDFQANSQFDRFKEHYGHTLYNLEIHKRFGITQQWGDSILNHQLQYLKEFKPKLPSKMYATIKAEVIGDNYYKYRNYWSLKNSSLTDQDRKVLMAMVDDTFQSLIKENEVANSWKSVKYLSLLPIGKLILEHPNDRDFEFDKIYTKNFSALCDFWKNELDGRLQEMLFIFNLQNPKVTDTNGFEACLYTGYTLIKSPDLKKIMQQWYGRKVRGAQAYNFKLQDTLGNMVRLEDFKGKVVYLEVWFTGCGACRVLAKQVDQKVYPKFKDNKDMVFISISMDKNRNQWLKSVASEHYGLKEHVHLYTNGQGMKHPFIKYYGIQGGPTTMIIDKHGKMFSVTPPKIGKSKELIALLEEALAK